MATKVRELIEDIVWGHDELQDVHDKTRRILETHVLPMIGVTEVLNNLQEWASGQSEIHAATASKIVHIHIDLFAIRAKQNTGIDADGVSALFRHHTRICQRYSAVSMEIHELQLRLS